MKEILLKSVSTKQLKKNEILSICKLKDMQWKHGLKSQINWFNENVQNNDIHNIVFLKGRVIGYALLRKRNFLIKNNNNNYFYYDTNIVSKKYRGLNIGSELSRLTQKVIKKSGLHAMLICEKKMELFYSKRGWNKKNRNKSKISDHKYSKKYSMMVHNAGKRLTKENIQYCIFS
tara:strand:+ start:653 stop:1177 length:525 start_codon:yes stop_codon:yes gene_type:complete